ncbi:MAG: ABC transporter permease [Kurthia sp.]|nr:ABC transporter permease [Candidatus Kurthia equi]
MRKVLLTTLGIIAGITFLCSLGHLVGLLLSAALLYAGIHFYLKANSTGKKVWWIIVGILGVASAVSNIPGLIGLLALAAMYWIYKKWQTPSSENVFKTSKNDPFTNFEKQWNNIQK